ncbi:MAG: pyruvate formate lyase family protein [Candidatus Baldrarchaeia archaeon]
MTTASLKKFREKLIFSVTLLCYVGNETSAQYKIPIYVEFSCKWIYDRLDNVYKNLFENDEEREELRKILEYWMPRTIEARVWRVLPDDVKDYVRFSDNNFMEVIFTMGKGRCYLDWDYLFKLGLKGVIARAEEKLKKLKENLKEDPRTHIEKINFYEAGIIACKALIEWARRYAELAEKLAQQVDNEQRREELIKIAEVCRWVPENPPRTFYEALQFFHFIHLAERLELMSHSAGYRFDQIMYPYYKQDVEKGILTKDKALELMECLWFKIEDIGELSVPSVAGVQVGAIGWQNLVLGGVKRDGSDATNDLSYLMIDATYETRTLEPAIVLRYHDNIPKDLIYKALDLIATGHGMPSLFNDNVIIPYLQEVEGLSLEEARDYIIPSCVRWGLAGKPMHMIVPNIGFFCMLKCLEFALNEGKDMYTGKQLGYPTPDPCTFKSIEDVKEAFLKNIKLVADKLEKIWNIATAIYTEYAPRPFGSILLEDCLEKGKEAMKNMYKERITMLVAGCTNVADSLAVIKKLVFDDKVITMDELLKALRNNWEGYEWLRQKAINDVPKFGNDDPYVDELMRWVHEETNKIFRQHKGIYGGAYTLESSIAAGYYAAALKTWATPDGRKAGEPVADATVSPMAGRDKNGPTAVLKSVSNLNPLRTTWNHLLNQRFLPQYLTGEYKEVFANYLKTWSKLPIWHIQFNVVSNEVLRDAQKNPEKYQNLVVRVAGYSARFIDLPKEVQDDIIRRTEQAFA